MLKRQAPVITNINILNYTLTLKYLEDKFYYKGLANYLQTDFILVSFNVTFYNNLKEISFNKITYISFLITTLTKVGVILVKEYTYIFSVSNPKLFIILSLILKGVGVSAYIGAVANIISTTYLIIVGLILIIKLRYSAYIRASLSESPFLLLFNIPLSLNKVYILATLFIISYLLDNLTLPIKAFPILYPLITEI